MAHIRPFHRIVILGTIYSDIFNVTLNMGVLEGTTAMAPATQALADRIRTNIGAWWDDSLQSTPGGGLSFAAAAKFTGIKVNRIGTDGKYMDVSTVESYAATPISGGGGNNPPAQLSLVASYRGSSPRSRAGRGRAYFPPTILAAANHTNGQIPAASALEYARGVRQLLITVTDAYDPETYNPGPVIVSDVAGGAQQTIASISVGRVHDTMRSRRNKIPEDPQELGMDGVPIP